MDVRQQDAVRHLEAALEERFLVRFLDGGRGAGEDQQVVARADGPGTDQGHGGALEGGVGGEDAGGHAVELDGGEGGEGFAHVGFLLGILSVPNPAVRLTRS